MSPKIIIIPRTEIQAVHQVMEGGEMHSLGEQRDFRRNPVLDAFLSEKGRLGVAWVRLGPDEELKPHRHPIRSMILVCRGRGVLLDHGETTLNEGDAILVPPGYLHGFRGLPPEGVTGLSIQFEDQGLYEDIENPLVNFEKGKP